MRSLAATVVIAFGLLLALPARGSVALALSVEQLTQKADLVVRGRVIRQESAWTRGGRIITTVHLAVDAALKGSAAQTLDVVHLGGHVGDIGQQVSGEVGFTQGEEVVLFLRAWPHQTGVYRVVGMSQGKFTVDRSRGTVLARQSLDGLGLVDKPGGAIEEQPGAALPLDELAARIARAAKP